MSDQRRFRWRSGRLVSTPLADNWAIDLDGPRDPSIPNLPLETAPDEPAGAPFFGCTTGNPPRTLHRGSVHVGATLLLTTLALAGFPRGPLVAPAKAKAQQQQHTLAGSPAVLLEAGAPAALPFVQAAQDSPVLTRRGLHYDARANLLLTTLAPLQAPAGQASLATRTAQTAWRATDQPPNLALTTLTPTGTTVWRAPNRPMPLAARAAQQPLQTPNLSIAGPVATPFVQPAQQSERRSASPAPGWQSSGPLPHDGGAMPVGARTDAPRSAATQAAPGWVSGALLQGALQPLPIGAIETPRQLQRVAGRAAELPPNLLVAQASPVFGSSQANPARPAAAALTWTSGLPLPFDGGAKPFLQSDWPVPKSAARPVPDWQVFIAPALSDAQPRPFAQIDWPNPLRVTPSVITWANTRPVPLDGGAQPFYQADWPNPVLRPWRGITWTSDQPPHDQGAEPFYQADWPNPTLRVQPAITWTNTRPVPFSGGDQPLSQTDWPLPVRDPHPQQPQTTPALLQANLQPLPIGAAQLPPPQARRFQVAPHNPPAATLAVVAEPAIANVTANPSRHDFPVGLLTFTAAPAPEAAAALVPLAFPNPPGAAFPHSLRGWSGSLPLPHDAGQKPGLQTDWPVPKGPQRPVADFAVGSPFALIRPASCPTPAEIWGYRLEGGFTAGDLLELMSAVLAGKTSISAGGHDAAQVEFRAIDDSAVRVAAQMQGSERASVALTPGSAAPASGDGAADFWNYPIEGGYTARDVMRLLAAVLLGKSTITGSGTLTATFRSADDSADRVQAQVTGSQRTSVTLTP